jgi:hypothetical protein
MAIDISKYNDTFKAFVDFASAAKKGSAIAQPGDATNGAAGSGACHTAPRKGVHKRLGTPKGVF